MLVWDHVHAGAGFLVMTGLEVTEQDICERVPTSARQSGDRPVTG
ncbi:hypothetical protein GCM10010304_79740 [Streptomyces roseoviolaceus]